MREVRISELVREKVADLEDYLINGLKLSEEAALRRSDRMREFVRVFSSELDYPPMSFQKMEGIRL